ncbi:hypothetical protein [Ostreiculturibacter nitratireducens]|uniref:hypothetical protein n=1 Tax=Ostreiculturibacter nitratireducens TaxID=3075226 RepID=UPI0031B582FF
MEIILHIGAHRTGTSSLQHWMAANAGPLAAAGTAVWGPKRTRVGLFEGLIKNPAKVTRDVERAADLSAARIAEEIRLLEASGMTRLIVSEENMPGSIRNNLLTASLYPDAAPRLVRIAEAFGGRVTRVALSIRGYGDWWSSTLAFAVGRGGAMPDASRLQALLRNRHGWTDVARATRRAFPEATLTVWPFESLGGYATRQFHALTEGAPLPSGVSPDLAPRNASPDRPTLRRRLARRGEPGAAAAIGAGEGRWMPFSESERATLGQHYAEDLAWFRSGTLPGMSFIESEVTGSMGAAPCGMTGE